MQLLSTIFEDEITTKSIVITDEQKIAIARKVNREFFSWVDPIFFISNKAIEGYAENIRPKQGLEIKSDEYGLGIGTFTIMCTKRFESQTAIKIRPIDYDTFKITREYQADYQMVCDYFLALAQQDNMKLLEGIGVQAMDFLVMTIQEVREILEAHYGTSTAQDIELHTSNEEC